MIWSEYVRMALSSIRSSRFRSFFTMLGVIIGVGSVITTVSLGDGIKHQVSGQTSLVGRDLITVRPGSLVTRDDTGKITGVNILSFLSSSKISEKDLQAIQQDPAVDIAVPLSIIGGVPSRDGEQLEESFIVATTDKLPDVLKHEVEFGSFFDEGDKNRKVAIIGRGVAEKLFKENVPIGKNFQIRGQTYVVGGVFERFPANPLSPEADFNNGVFIPYEAGKQLLGSELSIYQVLARPKDSKQVDQTMAGITTKIKENHSGQEDFTVLKQDEMAAVADGVLNTVTKTVTLMAAVALFVGGIGIMNVMLVSVTERTREIGIRKAVGATNRQIRTQFLVEAMVISIWGALIGVFLAGIINVLFRILTDLQPVITWQVVLVSAAISIAIGVLFGLIPAIQASRKDPIEALRTQ